MASLEYKVACELKWSILFLIIKTWVHLVWTVITVCKIARYVYEVGTVGKVSSQLLTILSIFAPPRLNSAYFLVRFTCYST